MVRAIHWVVYFCATLGSTACSTQIRNLSALELSAAADSIGVSWALANGANSIDLSATLTVDGSVDWAAFDSDPGTLTSAEVKSYVASCGAPCVSSQSFAAGPSVATSSATGLPDKKLYTIFAVASGPNGESAVKKYSGVIPRRLSLQQYASAEVAGSPIVRYYVYFPLGYYDHPATQYPGLLFVGGGGEIFNDASNDERYFTTPGFNGSDAWIGKTPYSGMIRAGHDYPFVIVQPQCNDSVWGPLGGCGWNQMPSQHLKEAIDQANTTYRTNPKKFYALGVSWGAVGVYALAYDYPDRVAAIVPMAGGLFGGRGASAATLCNRLVTTSKVAVWAISNDADPMYSDANVAGNLNPGGGNGVSSDNIVSMINSNGACAGHLDARETRYNDGATFPANISGHSIWEFSIGTGYYCMGSCGANGFYKNNGAGSAIPDTDPPTASLSLHPQLVSDLATASTANGATLTSLHDWMLLFSKP